MTGEREPTPAYHRHPRRFIELTAHTTPPLPVQRAEERNGETGNEGRPLTDKASGTQNLASYHPPAREEQTDEGDDGTTATGQPSNTPPQGEPSRNRERAGARERHSKEASRQTAAMPAAANQIDARTSHARGRGNKPKQVNREEQARGGRARERIFNIYIGTWDATRLLPSTIAIGISR